MRSPRLSSLLVMVPLAACATGETGSLVGAGGQGSASASGGTGASAASTGTGASSTSSATATSASSSTSGSGGVPTTCAETSGFVGCCDGVATFYYCPAGATAPESKPCPSGQVCGWEATNGYYGCTTPPANADPSGKYPKQCP